MGVRQIDSVDDLLTLAEGTRVDVKDEPPTEWVFKGGRLVRTDDESVVLSPRLFAGSVNAKKMVARTTPPPYKGDATDLVAALRDMAYENKAVRDVLIAHGAAELETCKIEVTATGTIEYPVADLPDPFTVAEKANGWLRWTRIFTLVRDDVMGCQCDTVTDDEVRDYIPNRDVPFEFSKKCNLH